MANPNIVNVSNIYGKVIGINVAPTDTNMVVNPSGSGKVFKINSLIISNINAYAADINVSILKGGISTYYLAKTISVPTNATLVVISKDTSIYLQEGDMLVLKASSGLYLDAVCSYEEIS